MISAALDERGSKYRTREYRAYVPTPRASARECSANADGIICPKNARR